MRSRWTLLAPVVSCIAIAGIAAAIALAAAPGDAQELSSGRPLRIIVATGVGGTGDVFMRVVGDEYHRRYGRPVVVENRTGGGMIIGGRACAEAPERRQHDLQPAELHPDLQPVPVTRNCPTIRSSFVPITNPFFNTQLLVVSTALGVKSLEELAALSKAKPGTLSYTVPSEPLAVFMDWWREKTGADLVRVPFKGGGDSVTGMLTGSTPVAFFGIGNWLPHLASGAVRPIAVDGDTRSPLLPEVPTLRELGYTADLTRTYFGLVAPSGTPQSIVTRIYEQVLAIGSNPEFRRKRLVEVGLEPVFDEPEAFARYLKEDRVRASRIVKAAGLTPQ